jgi:hypothetical protein
MKRVLLTALVVFNLLCSTSVRAQREAGPLVLSLPSGGFVAFNIELSPLDLRVSPGISRPPFVSRVLPEAGNVLHRLVLDEQGRFVFAYDLVITHSDERHRFSVLARALDPSYEQLLRSQNAAAFGANVKLPTLVQATERQTVANGGTLALDLLINESLAVKVVDLVTVASERSLLFPAQPLRTPRDFGLSNVELAIRNYQLYVDRQLVVPNSGLRNCTGSLVWFSLPGQGRFIFSLVPYEGHDFRKVGLIEDNKIAFTWKGVNYEWISREPIVGSGGLWNLWVLHDQNYVDIFDQPVAKTESKQRETARLFRKPVGVPIPLPKKGEPATLASHQSKKQTVERIRIVIGGTKNLDTLMLKK